MVVTNNSTDESKENYKVLRNDALHSFIHTSRYIGILENTVRYLLHLLGLSRFLTDTRIANYQHKSKIDYLENEIKVWALIKSIFEFIKQWYYVYYNYKIREDRIRNARDKIKLLKDLFKSESPQGGEKTADNTKTIEENERIEECKNDIKDWLVSIQEINKKIYSEIKDTVKSYYKLLNYTLKYLNNPQYYLKSTRVASKSPDKAHNESITSLNLHHEKHKIKNYKPLQLFKSIFPEKEMLENDIKMIKNDYRFLQT